MFWACGTLKEVRLANGILYISNYMQEIAVDAGNISHVSENRWLNINPITIHFKQETAFGNRIKFMPPSRGLAGLFSPHPVVDELRTAAKLREGAGGA
jgi:hypothetical protein